MQHSLTSDQSDFLYEYHRANISASSILTKLTSNTVIFWTPLKTCLDFNNCNDCQNALLDSTMCFWCNSSQKCTTGLDRGASNHDCKISLNECPSISSPELLKSTQVLLKSFMNQTKKLHQMYVIHEKNDNTYYDLTVEMGINRYWEIMVDDVTEFPSDQEEVAFQIPFNVTLMGEKKGPVMVIMRDGFVTFQEDLSTKNWVAPMLEYIAPLRADFVLFEPHGSRILYRITNDKITIEWRKVNLAYMVNVNYFSFQCHIYKNGNISFIYRTIPMNMTTLTSPDSDGFGVGATKFGPVMIGLSSLKLMPIKNEREHKFMPVDLGLIAGGTSVHFSVKEACEQFKYCDKCLEKSHCQWCSDGCTHLGGLNEECVQKCDHNKLYKYSIKQDSGKTNALWNGAYEYPLKSEKLYLHYDFPFFGVTSTQIVVNRTVPEIYLIGDANKGKGEKGRKISLGHFPLNGVSSILIVVQILL